MNANDAELVRVTTRRQGGSVFDRNPILGTSGNFAGFEVAVEGEAGDVLGDSGARYELRIEAFDITSGTNPHNESNQFTQSVQQSFSAADGWPRMVKVFPVALNDVLAVRGHLLKYYASISGEGWEVFSCVESLPFILHQ